MKAPPTEGTTAKIPMQYSGNTKFADDDEEVTTEMQHVLQMLNSSTSDDPPFRVNLSYFVMFTQHPPGLIINDPGSDTHVAGQTWLPLEDLSNPSIKRASLIGFESAARKLGLPVGSGVTKPLTAQNEPFHTSEGKLILLRSMHLVFNLSSPHTLISTFEMHEKGHQVDDVAKRHGGDQCIVFSDGNNIPFILKNALLTFNSVLPTEEELISPHTYIIDIGVENWQPQLHTDDPNALPFSVNNTGSLQTNSDNVINDDDECHTVLNILYDSMPLPGPSTNYDALFNNMTEAPTKDITDSGELDHNFDDNGNEEPSTSSYAINSGEHHNNVNHSREDNKSAPDADLEELMNIIDTI